ncbi:MAG TPA: DUF881 domain-containing protein [Candidatus Limnocylindrales bacterium]|nr:DUF881 domain-containing protein [Candidatus Limnocylindrales bacterium]
MTSPATPQGSATPVAPVPGARARPASRLAVAVVAAILGVLAIGQLRGQAGVPGLSALSSTELTQLIANLNAGNDRLRDEASDLARQEQKLKDAHDRGQTTVGELGSDLSRIRAWAGLTPVTGQGISILITGPIGGDGVEDLLNELRNAGAEAIAVDGVRVVTGTVVAGAPTALSVENHPIAATFEIRAIGSPQILTGTLTRTGGVIAQVTTTYDLAQITVTPIDSMTLPATERDLTLTDATPKL